MENHIVNLKNIKSFAGCLHDVEHVGISLDLDSAVVISTELGEESQAYASKAYPIFTLVKDISAQLAAVLILETLEISSDTVGHPSVDMLKQEMEKLLAGANDLEPTNETRKFHALLLSAVNYLSISFNRTNSLYKVKWSKFNLDEALNSLQLSWKELQRASKILPGFETVDLNEACCAPGHSH